MWPLSENHPEKERRSLSTFNCRERYRLIWMFKGWAGTSHTALGTEQCIQFVQVRSDTGYSYSNIPDGQGQVWIDLDAGWGGSPYEFWQGGISIYLRSFLSPEHTWTMTKTYEDNQKVVPRVQKTRGRKLHTDSYDKISPTFMSLYQTKWTVACQVCTCEWPLCGSAWLSS